MTVKPPRGVRSWENLAGCVGRSRLRNGHESFRFVRNGLESFLFRHQTSPPDFPGHGGLGMARHGANDRFRASSAVVSRTVDFFPFWAVYAMFVKPPKGVRSAGNLAGCVGRSLTDRA